MFPTCLLTSIACMPVHLLTSNVSHLFTYFHCVYAVHLLTSNVPTCLLTSIACIARCFPLVYLLPLRVCPFIYLLAMFPTCLLTSISCMPVHLLISMFPTCLLTSTCMPVHLLISNVSHLFTYFHCVYARSFTY